MSDWFDCPVIEITPGLKGYLTRTVGEEMARLECSNDRQKVMLRANQARNEVGVDIWCDGHASGGSTLELSPEAFAKFLDFCERELGPTVCYLN